MNILKIASGHKSCCSKIIRFNYINLHILSSSITHYLGKKNPFLGHRLSSFFQLLDNVAHIQSRMAFLPSYVMIVGMKAKPLRTSGLISLIIVLPTGSQLHSSHSIYPSLNFFLEYIASFEDLTPLLCSIPNCSTN